jgi:hypothetical protein
MLNLGFVIRLPWNWKLLGFLMILSNNSKSCNILHPPWKIITSIPIVNRYFYVTNTAFECNKLPGNWYFIFFLFNFLLFHWLLKHHVFRRIAGIFRWFLSQGTLDTIMDYFFSLWNSIVGYFSELAIYCRCYIAIFTSIGKRT